MFNKKKKTDMSAWPIPAFLFIGIGLGMIFTYKIPLAIPAFTLIGLGTGFLVTFLMKR